MKKRKSLTQREGSALAELGTAAGGRLVSGIHPLPVGGPEEGGGAHLVAGGGLSDGGRGEESANEGDNLGRDHFGQGTRVCKLKKRDEC